MILTLVLIVLTGCQTLTRADNTFQEILISEVPDLPAYPQWPDVTWSYEDGKYYLNEADVDKVLDYLENSIPLHRFELEQYQEQLQIIFDGLKSI